MTDIRVLKGFFGKDGLAESREGLKLRDLLGFPEMGNVLLVVRLTVAIVAIVEILCDTAVADLIIEVRDGIEPADIASPC